jgi:predicted AAA+ superfamily ATPase
VTKPDLPLEAYHDGAFKGFVLDIGLLAAKTGLPPRTILDGSRVFEEFKGALTEQFVQQEVVASTGEMPHYWASPRGDAEIDFLLQSTGDVIPVEVKASVNLQAKSLKYYCGKFRPPVAIRTSLAQFHSQTITLSEDKGEYTLFDLPLYAVSRLKAEIATP